MRRASETGLRRYIVNPPLPRTLAMRRRKIDNVLNFTLELLSELIGKALIGRDFLGSTKQAIEKRCGWSGDYGDSQDRHAVARKSTAPFGAVALAGLR